LNVGAGTDTGIQSLSGHTSAVECVAFDYAEEVVVAGSAGGTLKLWDLDEGKGWLPGVFA
jgi:katanin p80 WD40 repeat-containing subunit B1